MNESILLCSACNIPLGDHNLSLDRNVCQYLVTEGEGAKPGTEVRILSSWAMRQYDDEFCRHGEEETVVKQLDLKSAYPGEETVVPCSRCAAPVDRRQPHVSYEYMEYQLMPGVKKHGLDVYQVLDATVLAVLCQDCEEPDVPLVEAATEIQHRQERSPA